MSSRKPQQKHYFQIWFLFVFISNALYRGLYIGLVLYTDMPSSESKTIYLYILSQPREEDIGQVRIAANKRKNKKQDRRG